MAKPVSQISLIKNVTIYSTYLILIWAFYRFLFQFPEQIEELIIKPVLWLLPIVYLSDKENLSLSNLGFTIKNLFSSIYFSLGLGTLFVAEAVLINFLKYGGLKFGANIGNLPIITSLGLSFATAFSEETAFRGYIFGRLTQALKNEVTANIISTLLWTAIHVPIAFYIWKYTLIQGILYLALTAIFGAGSAFIYGRTKNIFGSIFLHVLWEWPIILFR